MVPTNSNWSNDLPQGISSSTSTSRSSSRKPSHSTSKMQYHANNEHQQERDCRKNPTRLFLRMNYQQWDKAIKHLHNNPAEARIWLTSTREHDGSLKFRYLPLHLAMIQSPDPPPKKFVEMLVHAYPRATQSPDHEGNLPIHIACGNDALFSSKDIITYLACSYPESLEIPNSNGLTPVDLVSKSQDHKSAILESLRRIQNETLQRKNKNKRSAPMSSTNHHFDLYLDDSYSIVRSSSVTRSKRDDRSVCSAASSDDMARKLQDLENKMERLIEENKKLQGLDSNSTISSSSSSSSTRSDSEPSLTLLYKEKINSLTEANANLTRQVHELQYENQEHKDRETSLISEVKELKSRNDDYEAKLMQEKAHSQGLSESNSLYREKIDSLQNALSQVESVLSSSFRS